MGATCVRFLIDECLDESLIGVARELHAGLIVLVPNVVPALQRALFEAAIRHVAGKDLLNTVVEVTLERKAVKCTEYSLPAE